MSNLTDKAIKKLKEKYDISEDTDISTHIMHRWDDSCGCDNGYNNYGGHDMACECHSTWQMLVTDNIERILDSDGNEIEVPFKYTKTGAARIKEEKADKKAKKRKNKAL